MGDFSSFPIGDSSRRLFLVRPGLNGDFVGVDGVLTLIARGLRGGRVGVGGVECRVAGGVSGWFATLFRSFEGGVLRSRIRGAGLRRALPVACSMM